MVETFAAFVFLLSDYVLAKPKNLLKFILQGRVVSDRVVHRRRRAGIREADLLGVEPFGVLGRALHIGLRCRSWRRGRKWGGFPREWGGFPLAAISAFDYHRLGAGRATDTIRVSNGGKEGHQKVGRDGVDC